MRKLSATLVVDGAHGEGGGALIRTALAMSALTQQPIQIHSVRGATRYPGLDAEDLIFFRTLAHLCAADVEGDELGANTLVFAPTQRPKNLNGALPVAKTDLDRGPNAVVLLNSLVPILARSGAYSRVSAVGETYGNNALSFDYFETVTIPALAQMGLCAEIEQTMAGFGREAAGEVTLDVEPSLIEGINWVDRGKMLEAKAIITTAELPPSVAGRAVSHLGKLAQHTQIPLEIEVHEVTARSPGAYITVWLRYERARGGGTAMGSKGMRIESVAQLAFEKMTDWMSSDATVDPFLADQILLPAVLAEGDTNFKTSMLTSRFLTSVWVIKQFLPIHITIRGAENGPGSVAIRR